MKNHLFLYALLIITVLLMVGCTPGIPQLPIDNLQGNEADQENQEEATGVPRVVFIELFNTEGCASSKVVNPIMEEIVAEYENTVVILVEEAGWGVYSTEETNERFKWYLSDKSELHTPSVCFDGLNQLFAEGFSLSGGGNSGNSGNETVGDAGDNEDPEIVEADTTKPVITGSRDPLPNSEGWNNTDVTVSFSCADTNPVKSAFKINTVAGKTLTTEGKDQSVTNTGVYIDAAGNTADPVTVSNINIDKTPPVAMVTLPGTGEYVLNQPITATWSATDALSGVVSPASGTVSIDTSSVGTKTLTLPAGTAKDKAGNSSLKVTKSYSVIADTEEPGTVYPQKWATGDGTIENPWANNCLNSALTNVSAGGTIFLKAGYYLLSTILTTTTKSFNLIGEGMGKSIIVLDIATNNGIEVSHDNCTFKGFTVDGDSQVDGTHNQCVILIYTCDYATFEDIEIKNGGYYGIDPWQINHSIFKNIHAHDNYRHGLHPGSNAAGRNKYNTYRDIYCWNNGVDGFDDMGNESYPNEDLYNVYDNIQCWDNGEYGIAIAYQKSGVLSNSTVSGNGKSGMWLSTLHNFNISNCSATLNDEQGIHLGGSENVNFTNVIVKNNFTGMAIYNCSGIALTACQSYDDRETPLQTYGLYLEGTNTGISLLNCKLLPNATGEINNPAGVVVTVITDKMLAKL